MSDKIVISGIGIISPLGHNTETTWNELLSGKSGIAPIQHFDASRFPSTIAAEVKNFDADTYFSNRKLLKQTVPFINYALKAADEALADAGVRPKDTTASRWGLVAGSGMMTAEYEYWKNFQELFASTGELDVALLHRNSSQYLSLAEFAKTQPNGGLGQLLMRYGIRGYANSVHTACASGGQALGLAMNVLRRGDADYMLAGGFDSMINPVGVASFCLLGALSTYNDTPETASRPFDLTRNGFVLGEGAAFLVLERESTALKRGSRIYAELAGEGNSISGYRITDSHPSGDGPIQAINQALADANESIDRVDYINAHGTSTKMNDLCESNAIKAVFKEQAQSIAVSSTKGQTGHLIAAAGALEAAICALSIHAGKIPQSANLNTPDPDCDLNFVINEPRVQPVRVALTNSLGFGGSNSCLILRQAST